MPEYVYINVPNFLYLTKRKFLTPKMQITANFDIILKNEVRNDIFVKYRSFGTFKLIQAQNFFI